LLALPFPYLPYSWTTASVLSLSCILRLAVHADPRRMPVFSLALEIYIFAKIFEQLSLKTYSLWRFFHEFLITCKYTQLYHAESSPKGFLGTFLSHYSF
jgi:hypothetical protein